MIKKKPGKHIGDSDDDGKSVDNSRLDSKLSLRRHFIERYHLTDHPFIFDACQGSGVMWRHLRKEFAPAWQGKERYFGVDLKAKKGRLRADSAQVLAQPGWEFGIIDIDTYGLPWDHFKGVVMHMGDDPITVFLTIGSVSHGGSASMSNFVAEAMGLRFENVEVNTVNYHWPVFSGAAARSLEYCLGWAYQKGIAIDYSAESPPGTHTRYLGLRIHRAKPGEILPGYDENNNVSTIVVRAA